MRRGRSGVAETDYAIKAGCVCIVAVVVLNFVNKWIEREALLKDETAEQLILKGKDTEARGELLEDGFVVRAGAMARMEIHPSARADVASTRKKLIDSNVLVEENGHYRLTEDYLFATPSSAAAVLLGRTSNGWQEWKTEDGKTLRDLKRAESE